MAFRHFLEKAEWRNDAFRYSLRLSAAFRHFPPFRLFQDPNTYLKILLEKYINRDHYQTVLYGIATECFQFCVRNT